MYITSINGNQVLKFKIFERFPEVFAITTTINSTIIETPAKNKHWFLFQKEFYESLNFNFHDISYLNQVHSNNVRIADEAGFQGKGDGMVTGKKGNYLSITTADCVPIFLYLPRKKGVALIHCGWKGAQKVIVGETMSTLKQYFGVFGSEDLFCGIGPHIKKCCYEFSKDDVDVFDRQYYDNHKKDKVKLDLTSIVKDQLLSEGLRHCNIEISELCTCCNEELLYSYRRENSLKGRMINIIGIQR